MPENPAPLPDFTRWPSFPFEGDLRVKKLNPPVAAEPPRSGEDAAECVACNTPDDAYMWVSERWRVRAMDRPTGLPMVLILECRSHLDLGDLPNLLAAELGVMTVRLERAIRSLDGVARVHVNRWGDGSAHLHMWFLARPYGQLQLRGTFLSLWDDILPRIPEQQWRENLALVAAWLAEFGGRAIAEPPHIQWQSPSTFAEPAIAGAGSDVGRSGDGAAGDGGSAASTGVSAARRASDSSDPAEAAGFGAGDGVADGSAEGRVGDAGSRIEGRGFSADADPSGHGVGADVDSGGHGMGVDADSSGHGVGADVDPGGHGMGADADSSGHGVGTGSNRGKAAEGTGGDVPMPAGVETNGHSSADVAGAGHGSSASDDASERAARVPRQAGGSAAGSRIGDHGAAVVD